MTNAAKIPAFANHGMFAMSNPWFCTIGAAGAGWAFGELGHMSLTLIALFVGWRQGMFGNKRKTETNTTEVSP